MKCFACRAERDPHGRAMYPYPEDYIDTEKSVPQLLVLECEGEAEFRVAVVCHDCFHKLDPDMWVSKRCWESLRPHVPYDQLPEESEDKDKRWLPETYAKYGE